MHTHQFAVHTTHIPKMFFNKRKPSIQSNTTNTAEKAWPTEQKKTKKKKSEEK